MKNKKSHDYLIIQKIIHKAQQLYKKYQKGDRKKQYPRKMQPSMFFQNPIQNKNRDHLLAKSGFSLFLMSIKNNLSKIFHRELVVEITKTVFQSLKKKSPSVHINFIRGCRELKNKQSHAYLGLGVQYNAPGRPVIIQNPLMQSPATERKNE